VAESCSFYDGCAGGAGGGIAFPDADVYYGYSTDPIAGLFSTGGAGRFGTVSPPKPVSYPNFPYFRVYNQVIMKSMGSAGLFISTSVIISSTSGFN
jgi:hypothetical protein